MTTDRFHDRHRSRRRFLRTVGSATGTALASAVSAGCLSVLSEDSDDPPPVDADEDELAAITEIERPSDHEELPVQIADAFVDEWVDRAESLLSEIPSSLEAEIPNEAVRRDVERERESAVERLEALEDRPTNLARLSTLRGCRRDAARAEGAYAAATAGRTPEDVETGLADLEAELSTVDAELTRVGDDSAHVAVVFERIERRLDATGRFLENARQPAPGRSTVEAVGELAYRAEWAAVSLEEATYLLERQAEVGDRTFDDAFETTASALLTDVGERLEEIPEDRREAAESVFDEPVDGTPRKRIGDDAVWQLRGGIDRAEESLADGRPASALLGVYSVENTFRALEALQSPEWTDALDRPSDADDVEEVKAAAIEEIESARAESPDRYLLEYELDSAVTGVRSGDRRLEQDVSHRSDRAAVAAVAEYSLAAARAKTVPETTDWFVSQLP
ncbi:hypothetical protein [Natrialba sp. INN-245]|uniref:hypothetical protein n=1 Tax=Natrialba sp. INN-245 TaxID=2690967 RepID=UPI0013106B17|nr:hypothetical protein [Natrialba sp. INN-245]MWV40459.1 hypothetical protein [Natrialba sp. INN-245]